MINKTLLLLIFLAITAFSLSDMQFTDNNGKTYSLFEELENGKAFLIQHEDGW